jgi:hypothetical protein
VPRQTAANQEPHIGGNACRLGPAHLPAFRPILGGSHSDCCSAALDRLRAGDPGCKPIPVVACWLSHSRILVTLVAPGTYLGLVLRRAPLFISDANSAIPNISRIQEDNACLIEGRSDVADCADTGVSNAAL